MGTKTISIMDDAYEILLKAKRKDESFSDVIRRMSAKKDITKYIGAWNMSDSEAEDIKNIIKDLRKKSDKELINKVERMMK